MSPVKTFMHSLKFFLFYNQCETCRYIDKGPFEQPCSDCENNGGCKTNWEWKSTP